MRKRKILVAGATGTQGSAVVEAFLAGGWQVRALVRAPHHETVRRLSARGVEPASGTFEDRGSLAEACRGVDVVFSLQPAVGSPPGAEVVQARNLAEAARAASVGTMIHSSVSATGWRDGLPAQDATSSPLYWDCKEEVERLIQASGFPSFVLLKPAFMMENFIAPKAAHMFSDLARGRILVAMPINRPVALVAARDIGAAALAAAERANAYRGQSIELAGDTLSMMEIGKAIAAVTGTPVSVEQHSAARLVQGGQPEGWVESQLWIGRIGYPARPEHQRAFGLTPTSFASWATLNEKALRDSVHVVNT